jgi:hypothetical protein
LHDAATDNLKVELCPCWVVVGKAVTAFPTPVLRRPVALLLITFSLTDTARFRAHIHDLFASCHNLFYLQI